MPVIMRDLHTKAALQVDGPSRRQVIDFVHPDVIQDAAPDLDTQSATTASTSRRVPVGPRKR